MAVYRYVKSVPKLSTHRSAKRMVSSSFLFIGIFLLVWVMYPIASFEITSRMKFSDIVSGAPEQQEKQETIAAVDSPVSSVRDEPALETFSQLASTITGMIPGLQSSRVLGSATGTQADTDYTHASNWFPSKPQTDSNTAGRIYFLTIPKLKIKDAVVKIAGEDLNKTLIHYGGTGLPGEYGTSVIFGHSILPQFYDPKNYKAIFSLLPTLDPGDEMYVKYDGVTYRYVIQDMRVADADDITVLEQRYDSAYIRLITCVPPGTYWKRLAVTARLQPA